MLNGRTIAMAVGGLLLTAAPRVGLADGQTKAAKVKCQGINECKGKGSCASAANACAGQNGCKGKGWLEVTAAACKTKGGTEIKDKTPADKKPGDAPKPAPRA